MRAEGGGGGGWGRPVGEAGVEVVVVWGVEQARGETGWFTQRGKVSLRCYRLGPGGPDPGAPPAPRVSAACEVIALRHTVCLFVASCVSVGVTGDPVGPAGAGPSTGLPLEAG